MIHNKTIQFILTNYVFYCHYRLIYSKAHAIS